MAGRACGSRTAGPCGGRAPSGRRGAETRQPRAPAPAPGSLPLSLQAALFVSTGASGFLCAVK